MTQQQAFDHLVREAAVCVRCERMRERQAVLGPRNGALIPKVLFIAEAPGRNGADRTRIPFHGDTSGNNFESLLASIQLSREEIFITNSVLCSPRKPSGANDKPKRAEIKNCSGFLARVIGVLNPPVVATLGAVALDALRLIEPHAFTLREHATKLVRWRERWLVPLYHPSPQVVITVRSLEQQRQDFRVLRRALAKSQEVRPIA